jgi:hypothetical protein
MPRQTMIVWLAGGIGNQLFQSAFGRALALKSQARVLFDPTFFAEPAVDRRYVLDKFIANVPLIRHVPEVDFDRNVVQIQRPLRMTIPRSPLKRTFRLICESRHFTYEPGVLSQHGDCFFKGYWQAQQYPAACRDAIMAAIRLPVSDLDTAGRTWLGRIRNSNSVALHVRRGDYLNTRTHSVHGLCDAPYYTAAMSLMRRRAPAAEFFVFSDDPGWCRQALSAREAHVVDIHSPDLGHLDMALMASCRHHVIANSTFSWWAAWLARHDAQIVVAPTPWTTRDGPAPDLFPPDWVVLDRATGDGPM